MYDGPLDVNKMPLIAKRAYQSWCSQRARCHQKRHHAWAWYGGKGVKVKYTSRDFINWWIKEAKGSSKIFVCDRIDSDGNYEFGNVQLISKSANALKLPKGIRHVPVTWHSLDGDKTFASVQEASAASGIGGTGIWKHCNGFRKKAKFSYAGRTKPWRKRD